MRRPSSDLGGSFVGIAFGAIGIVLLAFAAFLGQADSRLAAEGESAVGTVVEFRLTRARRSPGTGSGNDSRRFVSYREPVIRFVTRRGEAIEFVALNGSFPDDLEKGDTIGVVYLPSDPKGAEVEGSARLSGGAIAVTILGVACLVPAVVLAAWPAWKRRRRRAAANVQPRRWQRIEAQVATVRRLRLDAAAGLWRFSVTADWRDPATGRQHVFERADLRFDPALFARIRGLPEGFEPDETEVRRILGGAKLPVRVHPDDIEQYEAESLRLPGVAG